MCVRVSASLVALVLSLGLAAPVNAQTLSSTPAPIFTLPANSLFSPPAPSTFNSRATSLFAAGQIADRPTTDLRPRFHWGVLGSFIPHWSIPGSMGNWFFEDKNSPKMSGRDFRVGVVRARQLGFEMGASLVRKTVSSLDVTFRDVTNSGLYPTVIYSAPTDVDMTGVDLHLVIPFAQIGERVQLGILVGGGIAWLPDTPIQARIEGPPFYAAANSNVALSSPPPTGGFVHWGFPQDVPLVPGTRYAITDATLYDVSPTDKIWMLLRGQLAADFLLAPPLKMRLAAGFHFPGTQALGVDVVYLFRTGRVGTTQSRPDPAAAAAAQVADRPQVIAPRRSYWGVLAGATPQWWTPDTWGSMFEPDVPTKVEGREFRVGITRGRPLGYEFGVSFVQKSMTAFSFERQGGFFYNPNDQNYQAALVTLSQIDPVQIPGADFHAFIPIGRFGPRVQLGGLLGLGGAHVPDALIQKRVEGPPFVSTSATDVPLATLPASGGAVVDDAGVALPLPPGQTYVTTTANVTTISPLGSFLFLARAQIAADVLLAAPFKLRFSGGFNYPGAQLFGIEMVYLFGTGR
jgi:hypothetical protein